MGWWWCWRGNGKTGDVGRRGGGAGAGWGGEQGLRGGAGCGARGRLVAKLDQQAGEGAVAGFVLLDAKEEGLWGVGEGGRGK